MSDRTKTLCNCVHGAYFEREADSPKLLKTLKTHGKGGSLWNGGTRLAKQVLSQLSYTPTVGVTFILKHLPPLRELIPCGSPESRPRRKWRDSLSLRREQRTGTRPRIALGARK